MEVVRLAEELVSNASGGKTLKGSIPFASVYKKWVSI